MEISTNSNNFFSGLRLELPYLVNALAEDHGFFHRSEQFTFLSDVVLDHLNYATPPPQDFLVVGCDAGIDAYSVSIALMEIHRRYPSYPFTILATDFLADNLPRAIRGVYPLRTVSGLSAPLSARYFLRSRDAHKDLVRLRPGIRAAVRFRCQDIFEQFGLREPMDVIFCRHVLHHFEPRLAVSLAGRLRSYLSPGGLLFLGHDAGKLPGFTSIGSAIYQAR